MADIAFVGAGAGQYSTASITVPWPAGHQAADIGLLLVKTDGTIASTLTTANGFAEVTGSPSINGGTVRLTLYWCRATSSSMASPVVDGGGPGDHALGSIIAFRNCIYAGYPIEDYIEGVDALAGNLVIDGATTYSIESMIVGMCAAHLVNSPAFSGWTNANLVSCTEGLDYGGDGCVAAGYGIKLTPGDSGDMTATGTEDRATANMSIALIPGYPYNPVLPGIIAW